MTEALKSFKLIKSKLLSLLDFEDENFNEVEEAIKEVEHTLNLEVLERKTLITIKEKDVQIEKLKKCSCSTAYNADDDIHLENTLSETEFNLLKEL